MESGQGEKGRGQTGRRANSGQARHLSRSHSHTERHGERWDLEAGDAKSIISQCLGFTEKVYDCHDHNKNVQIQALKREMIIFRLQAV